MAAFVGEGNVYQWKLLSKLKMTELVNKITRSIDVQNINCQITWCSRDMSCPLAVSLAYEAAVQQSINACSK